jgi:deazaflavin-dependent oxidoreductase (nitroreductase family)
MSRIAEAYARVSPKLAHRPGSGLFARTHAKLLQRSGGRFGRRFLGADVVVLRTTGRKSGEQRDSPVFYVAHGGGWVVVAANAASKRPPAWWLNLEAKPDADAFVEGKWHSVRARRATDEEREAVWPRLVEMYRGYDHYESIATRELPVVVLEPR